MQEEKILKLTQTNEKYILFKDEITKLKKDLEGLINENMQLKNELLSKNSESGRLTNKIEELAQMNKNKTEDLQIKAKQDIETQKERTSFEKDKELLKLKEQQQFKIQELQERFNERVVNLLKEKEEAAENFKNMILQMDKTETEPAVIEKSQKPV